MANEWIEVSPDGGRTRYDVMLDADGEGGHWVAVHKLRRDTLLDYTQTIKPGSSNWKRAVRLAKAAPVGEAVDPLDDFNYVGSRHHY